jgi:hypothetical protein
MTDLRDFIFKGKNTIKRIKMAHCNMDATSLSFFFRNLKYSENINWIDVSQMHFNTEVLSSLTIAL